MSLEKESKPESIEVPKTVDETIVKYLAFQDKIHPDQKDEQLKQTYEFPKIKEYAQALMDLAHREGMQNVEKLADAMVNSLEGQARKLSLPLTLYGTDRSWAMFGLAKQFYDFQHPEGTPEADRPFLSDPMDNSPIAQDKHRELVSRELGREARGAYRRNPDHEKSWRKFVDNNEAFELAYDGLRKEPENPGDKMQSDELVELGTTLRGIGKNLEHQSEESEEAHIAEEIPAMDTREPQKSETAPPEKEELKNAENNSATAVPETQNEQHEKIHADDKKDHNKHRDSHRKKDEEITIKDVAKAGSYIGLLFPAIAVAFVTKKFLEPVKESIQGMWGVLKKMVPKGFAGLNAGVGAAPAKPAAHKKEDHAPKAADKKHDDGHH